MANYVKFETFPELHKLFLNVVKEYKNYMRKFLILLTRKIKL